MYAGDDVSSIVIDMGTDTTRIGYAGEDQAQNITTSHYGVIHDDGDRNGEVIVTEEGLNFARKNFEVYPMLNEEGFIRDFDKFETYLEGKLDKGLNLKISDSPLLFTEPSKHNKDHRLKLTEIMFEKCNIPCLFICKSAVLSSFSCGKSTCLVLDSGHSSTYAVPVHDGYILQNSTLKYNIGGKYVSDHLIDFMNKKGAVINPFYSFKKVRTDEETKVDYLSTEGYTDSYRDYHVKKILKLYKAE